MKTTTNKQSESEASLKTNNKQSNIGEMNMEKKIVANDDNIKEIVKSEIERLGNKADLNHIDVLWVTNMSGLFEDSDFNGDISKWNMRNVKDMSWMFSGSKFNGDISEWDMRNAKDMGWMFKDSKFNGDISKWNVENVWNMCCMFEDSPFDKNIDKWNYNYKIVVEPFNFLLNTKGSYTLIEKYIIALDNNKFDLADSLLEKIKFKMFC